VLRDELSKEYFIKLAYDLQLARAECEVYPPSGHELAALRMCDFDNVRVVIVGQDPYPSPGHAHGLAFSVRPGVKVPPSLQNIYKELERDEGVLFRAPQHGCLAAWAAQGVLLLNTCLTVRRGEANSHKGMGWEIFSDAIIRALNERKGGLVFLLWGREAHLKCKGVDTGKHDVLTAPHPSPLSAHRGFMSCGHFSSTNSLLLKRGLPPINWQLPMTVSEDSKEEVDPDGADDGKLLRP
jgi:uracil-DNA glycosylase